MAIAWLLKRSAHFFTVLVGVWSLPEQLLDNIEGLRNISFNETELKEIKEMIGIGK